MAPVYYCLPYCCLPGHASIFNSPDSLTDTDTRRLSSCCSYLLASLKDTSFSVLRLAVWLAGAEGWGAGGWAVDASSPRDASQAHACLGLHTHIHTHIDREKGFVCWSPVCIQVAIHLTDQAMITEQTTIWRLSQRAMEMKDL